MKKNPVVLKSASSLVRVLSVDSVAHFPQIGAAGLKNIINSVERDELILSVRIVLAFSSIYQGKFEFLVMK